MKINDEKRYIISKYNVFLGFRKDFESKIYFYDTETAKNRGKPKNAIFSYISKNGPENDNFSKNFKIVVLRVAERFLIQIFFVGLTNISTCRKHDFWTGGRFFLVPTEAFSPGHFSADPLDLAKIEKKF